MANVSKQKQYPRICGLVTKAWSVPCRIPVGLQILQYFDIARSKSYALQDSPVIEQINQSLSTRETLDVSVGIP